MSGRSRSLLLTGLVPLMLAGCGGSGSGSSGEQTTAGIDGTGARSPVPVVVSGTVTGFGSVIVNGIRFDTTDATFTIDGEIGTQSDLSVGDVVTVRGELDEDDLTEGTASSVEFDDLVEGPIASIDVAAGVLTVLGQTVRVTADTSFDDSIQPASLAGLAVGDVIEVTGLVASDGSILATRLELRPASVEAELTGVAEDVDAGSRRFTINGQLVDYSTAILNDFDDGTIDDGDLVEVKASSVLGPDDELLAIRIEFKGEDITADDDDRVEIEGLISRFGDITDFDVAGFSVTTEGNVAIEGGTASDLGLDIKVEVEGTLRNGVLVATEIELRQTSNIRVAARVDAVNTANDSFEVLGITIKTNDNTRYEDKGPLDLESLSFTDLRVGDFLEVRGAESPGGSGELVASLIERDDDSPEVELRGFIMTGSVIEPSFSILGVTITSNGATVFRDANEAVLSPATFYSAAEGRLVEVEGREIGDRAITAEEIQFED